MGEGEIRDFLSFLATQRNVAASTQNQALAASLFLYREVLGRPLEDVEVGVRAKRPERLPVVLNRDEVRRVIDAMTGASSLVAGLLYGSGLRLTEALELRIKDVDFDRGEIRLRDGKGRKDRVTMLSMAVQTPLREHLHFVRQLHERDLEKGLAASHFRMRWRGNIRMPTGHWAGSGYFLQPAVTLKARAAFGAGIICMRRWFNAR